MFSEYPKEDPKFIEALRILARALDDAKNPNRDMYIQAALFTGCAIFIDFLGHNANHILNNHDVS